MLAEREQTAGARAVSTSRFVPSLYQVALIAIMGAIFVVAVAPRVDTDFWWHLKTGQYIWTHHTVPSVDFMSFTMRGQPWTDHEWLTELWFFGLYSLAGLWGPIVAFALVICAAFGFVYATMRRQGVHPVLALFILAAAFMASSASWGPRVQMLSLFFCAVYAYVLLRFDQSRNRRLLAVFPLLMLLWANMHAGFVLGLVLLAAVLVGAALNRLTGLPGAWSASDLRALGITLLVTFAVTVVNPHTYRLLLYPLTFITPNQYTNLIQESASPDFHMPVMMVFEAMLLLLIAAFFVGRSRVNWVHVLLVLGFTHLALSQVRNVALWSIVVAPLVAVYLQQAGPVLQELFGWSYRRRPVKGRLGAILNIALLVLVALAYLVEGTRYVNQSTLNQSVSQNFPIGGVRYLEQHHLPPRVYTAYEWGGYLLWKLSPRYTDFMDSRADTLYNNRILHAYLGLYAAAPGWQNLVRQYNIQEMLITRQAPLAQVLAEDPAWHRVYSDKISLLYARGQP
ncbi:MAG TPA: hypothetical protein VFB58_16665 [Chloroflexota bacterium]|nr:hypothetical protein [Chloroflexota bacterium]